MDLQKTNWGAETKMSLICAVCGITICISDSPVRLGGCTLCELTHDDRIRIRESKENFKNQEKKTAGVE